MHCISVPCFLLPSFGVCGTSAGFLAFRVDRHLSAFLHVVSSGAAEIQSVSPSEPFEMTRVSKEIVLKEVILPTEREIK